MTNTRIAAIGYVVLAIAAGLFLEHVLLAVFGTFGPTQPLTRPLAGDWTWCSVIGLGLTIATAVYLWTNPRTHEVSLEIVAELRKVSWPSFAETRAATIVIDQDRANIKRTKRFLTALGVTHVKSAQVREFGRG